MPNKDSIVFATAVLITLVMLLLSIVYTGLAISINYGRIDQYVDFESKIRQKLSEAAKDPNNMQLKQELEGLIGERDSVKGQIGYGKQEFWHLTFSECFLPLNPDCFHRNSSETNNVWLALAGGTMGVCLTLLLSFRASVASSKVDSTSTAVSVICLIPTGMIVGLLMLYLLKGTKGTLLTPFSEVVQVENPYGIAFACVAAGFFSERFLSWLLDHIPIKTG